VKLKNACFNLNSSKSNQFCIEASWTLCSWLRISSNFYPTISLAY